MAKEGNAMKYKRGEVYKREKYLQCTLFYKNLETGIK